MHMQGEPRTMQVDPRYDDVASEVAAFLEERMAFAVSQGIAEERSASIPASVSARRSSTTSSSSAGSTCSSRSPTGADRLLAQELPRPRRRRSGCEDRPAQRERRRRGRRLRARRVDLRVHDVREHVEALAVARAVAGTP